MRIGGGATDVRRSPFTVADRILIAGGGGGKGYNYAYGGNGGLNATELDSDGPVIVYHMLLIFIIYYNYF